MAKSQPLTTRQASIYAIGSGPLGLYFYIGSTVKPIASRLTQHLSDVQADRHCNRYFSAMVKDVGVANCWIKRLDTVNEADRFISEYEWIGKAHAEGIHLTNIIKSESAAQHIAESRERNRKEALTSVVKLWVDNFPKCNAIYRAAVANPSAYPEITGIRLEIIHPSMWEICLGNWFKKDAEFVRAKYGDAAFEESLAYIQNSELAYIVQDA